MPVIKMVLLNRAKISSISEYSSLIPKLRVWFLMSLSQEDKGTTVSWLYVWSVPQMLATIFLKEQVTSIFE